MEQKNEIWKDIQGFEGHYQVSNLGRVRSLDTKINSPGSVRQRPYCYTIKGRIMKPHKSNSGYMFVQLTENHHQHGLFIHRIVATAFLPNPNKYDYVNHKDEDKTNNFIFIHSDGSVDSEKSNLEWCTAKYNVNYGTCQERNQVGNIRHRKPVLQMTIDGKIVGRFSSINEARTKTGINKSSISYVCRGITRNGKRYLTAGGYFWKYAE